jgi:hypothetical protein
MSEPDMMQFETEKTVEDGPKGSPNRPPTTPNARSPSKQEKKGCTTSATRSTGTKVNMRLTEYRMCKTKDGKITADEAGERLDEILDRDGEAGSFIKAGPWLWADDWRNRSTATFDAQCWRIAKQLELFVYPKQRQFIRKPRLRKRGAMADQRARRDGLTLTRRGWVEQMLDMGADVTDPEAEGTVRDIGVGGYRRERIVGGKWNRAARRTWRAGMSDSDESEGDAA